MEFTYKGQRRSLTKQQVEQAMQGVMPEPRLRYTATVNGIEYPPKQVFAIAMGEGKAAFTTQQAFQILMRLDFPITTHQP
jgi:hypothetical protein